MKRKSIPSPEQGKAPAPESGWRILSHRMNKMFRKCQNMDRSETNAEVFYEQKATKGGRFAARR